MIYVAPRNGPGDRFVYFVWQRTSPRSFYFAALTIAGGCHEPPPGGSIEGGRLMHRSEQLELFDRFGCRISCSPVPESKLRMKITPKLCAFASMESEDSVHGA